LDLLSERNAEKHISWELLDGGCLLCSEEKPDNCHRRLVAEYLSEKRGQVDYTYLSRTTLTIVSENYGEPLICLFQIFKKFFFVPFTLEYVLSSIAGIGELLKEKVTPDKEK